MSGVAQDESTGAAGALGILAVLLWLIASALVVPVPVLSAVAFVLAGLLCFAGSADYPDLGIWGVISLILAVLALIGWRGKRKQDAEKRLLLQAAESQKVMVGMLTRAYTQTQPLAAARAGALTAPTSGSATGTVACSSCGTANAASSRFRADCGTALGPRPSSAA